MKDQRILSAKVSLTGTTWILIAFLLANNVRVFGQTDTVYTARYLEKSTTFGWTTLGMDVLMLNGGKTDYLNDQSVVTASFGKTFIPRVTIGGVHFWGHADFYVTLPLSFLTWQQKQEGLSRLTNLQGIETGARLYPWKLQAGRLSPFAGISFRLQTYGHRSSGIDYEKGNPEYQKMVVPLQLGATYTTTRYLITASAYLQQKRTINYYLTPSMTGSTTINPVSFNISFIAYWDTDKSMRRPEGIRQENLKHQILKKENKLSAWYWGLGPSAGIQMSKSDYLKNRFPYLYHDYAGSFTPDITFGRFFSKPDINVGVAYRTLGVKLQAFDARVKLRRHSFMVESYKYLFNYLGFVPFVGATGSLENLRVNSNGDQHQQTKPAIGLIAGWDIRVTKTGTSVLRTNLRWVPGLHMKLDGDKVMFDQLEFNFIQWVQFIGRKNVYNRYRSK